MNRFIKTHGGKDAVQYVGIAVDEPKRLARLEGTNRKSMLAEYGYTEQMTYDLCMEYDLLSPIYEHTNRGGCWFCPNSNTQEFIHIKKNHPELWGELRKLAQDPDTISDMFRRNKTFWEIDEILDQKIKEQSH